MKWPAPLLLAPLVLPLVLCACQDNQARQQNAELSRRVAALEQQVKALQEAQAHAPTVAEAGDTTIRAAAQNCALGLARTLEEYRQNSEEDRYPATDDLELPQSCDGQKVKWKALKPQSYSFSVLSDSGQELAQQSGP